MRTAIILAILATSAIPAVACETTGKGVLLGGTVGMTMHPGETCEFTFAAPGSSFGLGGTATSRFVTIRSIRIASRPAHGQAGRAGLISLAYKAAPAYRGPDSFEVEVETEQRTLTVPVSVTIR